MKFVHAENLLSISSGNQLASQKLSMLLFSYQIVMHSIMFISAVGLAMMEHFSLLYVTLLTSTPM